MRLLTIVSLTLSCQVCCRLYAPMDDDNKIASLAFHVSSQHVENIITKQLLMEDKESNFKDYAAAFDKHVKTQDFETSVNCVLY